VTWRGATFLAVTSGGHFFIGVKMNRFDYVKYDQEATKAQEGFKNSFLLLEQAVDHKIYSPRAKALALTKLEEAYMWIGKAIRDDQIVRNGSAELEEGRGDA
jgi:hypothetical protein